MSNIVVFDRDGVINELVYRADGQFTAPWNPSEWKYIPGIEQAVDIILELGLIPVVITNQPAVQDGCMTIDELNKLNKMFLNRLGIYSVISAIDRKSKWYKPNGDSFELMINKFGADRTKSYLIGDRWKDIVPAYRCGMKTFYVGEDKYFCPTEYSDIRVNYTVKNALEACLKIKEIENARI